MSVVYAISDLHGQLPEVPECDLLLIGGDICPDLGLGILRAVPASLQSEWLDTHFRRWLTPVVERGTRVVAIWGNHDFIGERSSLVPELPWLLLQDSEVSVMLPEGPLRVFGTPWVPGLPRWAFYADERALRLRAASIPNGVDVLLTHGPPYGAGDFIATSPKQQLKYGNYTGVRVGDEHLAERLRETQPRFTVCGHIHEQFGEHILEGYGGALFNTAAVDDSYVMRESPFTRLWV